MKSKDEIEQILISETSIDELIKKKIEQEFKTELEKSKHPPVTKVETELSKVPKHLIFSKDAVYKVFNRKTKVQTYVNGIQAESMLGLQNNVREKILHGEQSAFTTDDAYVKFERIILNVQA